MSLRRTKSTIILLDGCSCVFEEPLTTELLKPFFHMTTLKDKRILTKIIARSCEYMLNSVATRHDSDILPFSNSSTKRLFRAAVSCGKTTKINGTYHIKIRHFHISMSQKSTIGKHNWQSRMAVSPEFVKFSQPRKTKKERKKKHVHFQQDFKFRKFQTHIAWFPMVPWHLIFRTWKRLNTEIHLSCCSNYCP